MSTIRIADLEKRVADLEAILEQSLAETERWRSAAEEHHANTCSFIAGISQWSQAEHAQTELLVSILSAISGAASVAPLDGHRDFAPPPRFGTLRSA